MVNHFEFEQEISNKKNLFLNFFEYCGNKGINPFNYIPMTVIMRYNSPKLKSNIENFKKLFNNVKDFINDSNVNYADYFSLEHRDNMITNINNARSNNIKEKNNFINPKIAIHDTHIDYNFKNLNYLKKSINTIKNTWILKPTDLFGGKCIQIFNDTDDFEKNLKKFYDGIDKKEENDDSSSDEDENIDKSNDKNYNFKYRTQNVILQKYIEKPFLYNGRKFDCRVWVLITHHMKVYMFKEGHLKTCSTRYDNNSQSKIVHITNYCMQKNHDDFNKFEEGNEVSFPILQKFLDDNYNIYINNEGENKLNNDDEKVDSKIKSQDEDKDNNENDNNHYNEYVNDYIIKEEVKEKFKKKLSVKEDLYPQIIKIIQMTIDSVRQKINKKNRKHCFLILGYDFIIDENFKVWLLEVNKNSGLTISSNLIKKLVPRMIDDCIKLTVDTVFETENTDNGISRFPVDGYSDKENMWMNIDDESVYY